MSTGCATVIHQLRSGEIAFTSDPDGAEIKLANGMGCTTPCKLVLEDVVKQEATASLDGVDQAQTMLRRPAVPFWLNLIVGVPGVIGMGIDWLTGDMWVYKKDAFFFDFAEDDEEGETAAPKPPPAKTPSPPPVDAAPKAAPAAPAASGAATLPDAAPPPVPDAEAPLPESAALAVVKQGAPEPYLATQVRYYYGRLTPDETTRTMRRLYRILLAMQAAGERLDTDEAIRRDRFEQLGRHGG